MTDHSDTDPSEYLRREIVQFEKRFDYFVTTTNTRLEKMNTKMDRLPWLLLGIIINLFLSLMQFV